VSDGPLSVEALRGVGPALAAKLARLDITRVSDLLFHLPLRYQDRTRITPIAALQLGLEAVVEGEVRAADIVLGRRRSLVVRLQDHTGTVTLRFFYFNAAQKQALAAGTRVRCFGEARRGASGLELYHPEYRVVAAGAEPVASEARLTPIYPATEGISQMALRKLCAQAVAWLADHAPPELVPAALLPAPAVALADALRYLHQPPPDAPLAVLREGRHPCQLRLAFEELLAHNLSLHRLRSQIQASGAPPIPEDSAARQALAAQLPFALTAAQRRVGAEIAADLARPRPMLRLVQGDVGSGKTVVAALAALQVLRAGYQVAVMAPTEILAEQHLASFSLWLEPLGVRVGWLTGRQKGSARNALLAALASGELQLVVGTHALFQEAVEFAALGLAIIDEQHRFGVHQRLALREKGKGLTPHQLIMTATPIPRTLAMSAYADLDTSVIDELPPGRQPVATAAVDNQRRPQVVERIRAACLEGRQAYWVCTLIEESESLQAQAAEATCEALAESLPGLTVGLVHGRLSARDKAAVMARFKAGEIQLLVATTVIEVGVDVPNASLMVIENPERLGLAQLHQLRGRVGRGSAASHCLLLYQTPLSRLARQRLQVLRDSNDGFFIAEQDLLLRGPGEVLGTRQTGLMSLRVADLERHADLLPAVQDAAGALMTGDPRRVDALIRRWLPQGERYAGV
jgi:ATP-dependent DNA helicase RecG